MKELKIKKFDFISEELKYIKYCETSFFLGIIGAICSAFSGLSILIGIFFIISALLVYVYGLFGLILHS